MSIDVPYLVTGLLIHVILLYIVHRQRFLKWPDGIISATILSFTGYLANFLFWLILISFFIPASILSNLNKEKKKNLIISEKASQRRGSQVIANSAGFLLFSIFQLWDSGINGQLSVIYFLSASIYLVSASSDTWSTEIGTLSKSEPRNILNLKERIPKGTSGGVTLLGSFGGLVGSGYLSFIAIILLFRYNLTSNWLLLLISLVLLGFLGQVIDSVLGATLQKKYYCPNCGLNVEHEYHNICQSEKLNKIKSYTFLDNNTVNFLSSSIICAIGFFLFSVII